MLNIYLVEYKTMEQLNNLLTFVNDNIFGYILIFSLIGCGLYFTFALRFVQFCNFKEMLKSLTQRSGTESISSFQAFCISTAARVGTGNIAGVAIAIITAGPGAVFWMWAIAVLSSASAFAESVLAQIYKVKEGGMFRGGPAYYMSKGLGKKWLASLFAVILVLTFAFVFISVQANTITAVFGSSFNIKPLYMGIFLVIVTGIIIFGGLKRIAHFSQVVVPFFAGVYIIITLIIVIMNFDKLSGVFYTIFTDAFSFRNAAGGALGATIMTGARRGLFSNEAGMGSAPNAAATARAKHPVNQGFVQIFGVFVDTLVICSCTAFIVLLSDYTGYNGTGIVVTQAALASHVGTFGVYFVCFSLFLFAFTTIVGNYYYGQSNVEYLTQNKKIMLLFRLCVLCMVMFGALTQVAVVWNLADLFMTAMALINIIAILLLSKFVIAALKDYKAQKAAGEEPVFRTSSIPGLGKMESWEE